MTSYGMKTTISGTHTEARAKVQRALQEEGFGVLSEIDVRATLQEKIGEAIEGYEILGACNPHLAHRALSIERDIGLLLPCNVVLRDVADGVEVSIIDPEAMFAVAEPAVRERLADVVADARERLQRVLEALG